LAVILAVLALLAGVSLPVLAGNRLRSDRLACVNNLRQLGQAFASWANDRPTAALPWRTPPPEGLYQAPAGWQVYPHFAVLSNELRSAAVLACPSDQQTRMVARDFSALPGGLLHADYQNKAISYFVFLEAGTKGPEGFVIPDYAAGAGQPVTGDRNFRVNGSRSSCSALPDAAAVADFISRYATGCAWTNDIHGLSGNLLLLDGSVWQVNSDGLVERFHQADENGAVHVLMPKH
jgi:hypothetical protein